MDITQNVKTNVSTNNGMIRPNAFRVVAGPCTVESYDQFAASAKVVKQAGYEYVRGGAFKPRTSPYSFQGLGNEGLEILSEVSKELGLKAVTEVLDPQDIELVMEHAPILQIGARNMANFSLLKAIGSAISGSPDHGVILKRGFAATVEEWILAAEYVTSACWSRRCGCPARTAPRCPRPRSSRTPPPAATPPPSKKDRASRVRRGPSRR